MSVFGVILVRIFPAFFRIRTEYGVIRSIKNAGKMRTRITPNTDSFYTVLITKVRPYVGKQKRVRDPISVEEKLAVTLLFLATGESYKSLKHQFRISDSYGCSFVTNQASKTQNFREINFFYVFAFLCPLENILIFSWGIERELRTEMG